MGQRHGRLASCSGIRGALSRRIVLYELILDTDHQSHAEYANVVVQYSELDIDIDILHFLLSYDRSQHTRQSDRGFCSGIIGHCSVSTDHFISYMLAEPVCGHSFSVLCLWRGLGTFVNFWDRQSQTHNSTASVHQRNSVTRGDDSAGGG